MNNPIIRPTLSAALAISVITVVLLACAESPSPVSNDDTSMAPDTTVPVRSRVLSITDLPPLKESPKPEDYVAAIDKSRKAGCNGAVLTFSWPALEPRKGEFELGDLNGALAANKGRLLYLGIQVLNTTVKELPKDIESKSLDDPEVTSRFHALLDRLAPLLKNRVRYLSIGNESDIYLSLNPAEMDSFAAFLKDAREHAKTIKPELMVGTTLTFESAVTPKFKILQDNADAHFLTYYHGKTGFDGEFKDTSVTKDEILALAAKLDARPIIFQEIGFPAHPGLGSAEKQEEFVTGLFDAWDELGDRVPFLNYFMMYDFPRSFARAQSDYYALTEDKETFVDFVSSLGLHDIDGNPRPGWKVFEERGKRLDESEVLKK